MDLGLVGYVPCYSSGRTVVEIKSDLLATQAKIDTEVKEKLQWRITIPAVGKKICRHVVENPVGTVFRVIFLAGFFYIAYLLFRGIAAGIEVDNDNNFLDLFSANITTRLNAGLNLTNGDQAGQFVLDLVLALYATYGIFIRKPYFEFVSETLNEVYNRYLLQLLETKNTNSEAKNVFFKNKEELDMLFCDLKKRLKHYNGESDLHKKLNPNAELIN